MNLPSQHQIGDPVWIKAKDDRPVAHADIQGNVRYIVFSTGKVRYGVYIPYMETTFHNIDSVFVEPRPNGERLEFDLDNLS